MTYAFLWGRGVVFVPGIGGCGDCASRWGASPPFGSCSFPGGPMRRFSKNVSTVSLSSSVLAITLCLGAAFATACGSSSDDEAGDGDSTGGDGDTTAAGDGDTTAAGDGDTTSPGVGGSSAGGATGGDGDSTGGDGDVDPVDPTPDCGGTDQECCDDMMCDPGFDCEGGGGGMMGGMTAMCVACGAADEACCEDNTCGEGVCVGGGGGAVCQAECGDEGQSCCGGGGGPGGGAQCGQGLQCGEDELCESCGTEGLACCPGRGGGCSDGSDCSDGICTAP